MNKITRIVLFCLIIGAFVARLYKIDNPIADWHSWRQADTSAVTRNFIKFGFNPFIPRYDDISNIQTGRDNPVGYRFVEFPLYNSISYAVISATGNSIFTIEIWQRLVSILFSLCSMYFIYKITSHFSSSIAGLGAAFFFGFLPYSIYYSRVILPEPTMVSFSLGSLYTFILWREKSDRVMLLILSAILASCAILVKPYAVFFFPPILVLLKDFSFIKKNFLWLVIFCLLTVLPFVGWRMWMKQFPEGIPAFLWLLNNNNIRFKGAFFYWIFAERISKLILGYFGIFFVLLGVIFQSKYVRISFFNVLALSMILYLFIFAGGNVQHDYYQVIIVPILAMYAGLSLDYLITNINRTSNRFVTYAVICIATLFCFGLSWYYLRTYYWVNNPIIVEAGRKADMLVPQSAKIIAPYGGDTAFLYQTGRQGWPQGLEIEKKIEMGATHYVSVTPQDAEVLYLKQNYPTLFEADKYIILQLQ
jgi:hypothetical protein